MRSAGDCPATEIVRSILGSWWDIILLFQMWSSNGKAREILGKGQTGLGVPAEERGTAWDGDNPCSWQPCTSSPWPRGGQRVSLTPQPFSPASTGLPDIWQEGLDRVLPCPALWLFLSPGAALVLTASNCTT